MGKTIGKAINVDEWVFPLVPPSYNETHKLLVHFPSENEDGIEVPAMLLAPSVPPGSSKSFGDIVTTCVIYFHANACDIGDCLVDMATIRDGAYEGDAVVLAPEYPGYGLLSQYEASNVGIDRVALSAWRYVLTTLGFEPHRVMLWGRSIGTGPSTGLAHTLGRQWPDARAGGHYETLGIWRNAPVSEIQEAFFRKTSEWDSWGFSKAETRKRLHRLTLAYEVLSDVEHRAEYDKRCDEVAIAAGPVTKPEERPLGGLVLLAPFCSISEIVMAHSGSPLLTSIVAPLWEISKLVTDPGLGRVPVCVVHPKEDELVPGEQAELVLERTVSSQKFGLWLIGASHNFMLEEEMLYPVRDFLSNLDTKQPSQSSKSEASTIGGDWKTVDVVPCVDSNTLECDDIVARLTWWGTSGHASSLRSPPGSPRAGTPRALSPEPSSPRSANGRGGV